MLKIQFSGNVLPLSEKVFVKNIPQIEIHDTDHDYRIKANISVEDGRATVALEVNKPLNDEVSEHMFRYARMFVRSCVNLISLSNGLFLSVHLDSVVIDGGEPRNLFIKVPNVLGLMTAYGHTASDVKMMLQTLGAQPAAVVAAQDLIDSLEDPDTSPIYYYRAVETLRNIIAGDVSRKKAWPIFNKALNLSEDYTKLIAQTSTAPRHGNFLQGSPTDDMRDAQRRAWTIMSRYIEYVKRGSQPLPADEFPPL